MNVAARPTTVFLVGLVCITGALVVFQCRTYEATTVARARNLLQLERDLPRNEGKRNYVSSNQCRACHPAEHASWHATFHRTMTQAAVPENVAGEFDGTAVVSDGLTYRIFREGDAFWAEMPDPEELMYVVEGGKPTPLDQIPREKRRVVMTTGSHHYQTYWVSDDDKYGNLLQTLPLVYLIKDRKWIPREAAFMRAPESKRMVTQWNHHCIKCHSTGGVPGLVGSGRQAGFDTRVAELGISCEACHGPGETHIRRHRDPLHRYWQHFSDDADPTIVNPARLDHRRSSHVCGQCHGVFIERTPEEGLRYAYEGSNYRPGDDIEAKRYYIQYPGPDAPAERRADLAQNPEFFAQRWWDDGTILAGGREYTAMSASACYTAGEMSCLSCHSMHQSDPRGQMKAGMNSSSACTQCHDEPQYTTRLSEHTHHSVGSTGSDCLNCHMPHTTYALFRAIRTHQIASPSAAPSARHGVPNACNLCHLDQTLDWTQQHLADWYGQERPDLPEEHREVSAAVLWLLKGHAAQRAIAAWHAGWAPARHISGEGWIASHLAPLLSDPYGVVRYIAAASLRRLPGFENFDYDFLADAKELQARSAEAVKQGDATAHVHGKFVSTVLRSPDGQLDHQRQAALLKQRDDRPVTIQE